MVVGMKTMEQHLINWLKDDFESFKEEMKDSNKELNDKVDQILQFKWQIVGGSVVISAVVGVLIQVILAIKL
jgi:hypothetical protein